MNENKPYITVLMATFNEKPEYLSRAIDSIVNQSFSNFEFLICDDSTSDETISLLNRYAENDERIRIIRSATRLGFVKSLNEGIRLAQGQWIARMDSDDMAFPNRFEEEIKYIKDGVGVIAGQFINIQMNQFLCFFSWHFYSFRFYLSYLFFYSLSSFILHT